MELLLPGFDIIEQEPELEGMWRQAELCARVCYKSQDLMKDKSTAEEFVKRVLIHSDVYEKNHGAMLEHATVYLSTESQLLATKYYENKYSKVVLHDTGKEDPESFPYKGNRWAYYITTNLRVVYENDWMNDLQFMCAPTEWHERRVTVLFTVDRFTGEEFIRHRVASFGRESTRYVNFFKERFGRSIKFILPPWLSKNTNEIDEHKWREMCGWIFNNNDDIFTDIDTWLFALYTAEWSYFNLVNRFSWQPQQARTVLPCAISSPLVMTAFVSDWKHFFNLRYFGITGNPHPQAKELAEPLYHEFVNRKIIEEYNPNDL